MLKLCRSLNFLSHRGILLLRRIFADGLRLAAPMLVGLALLSGCKRFRPQLHEHVYVAARQVYLHDRVAAVSNRVGQVTNGEALEVLEKGKRFVKVRTPKGEVGWLEIHAIIDDQLFGQFQDLTQKHAQDPAVANAQLRDDLYLHVLPGRESAHFLLIPGNAKVQLLQRGTVEKAPAPGMGNAPKAKTPAAASGAKPIQPRPPAVTSPNLPAVATLSPGASPLPSVPIPMEDWWLVRDSQGHTGWLLANRLDVDVPEEVGGYAEGQRMVGAYPLAKVTDDGSGRERKSDPARKSKGKPFAVESSHEAEVSAAPVSHEFTEYVTVLTPPRGGLPFDFDQVRVFTWSLNHHRYETAFRLHGIQGYLPVRIGQEMANGQSNPTFTFQIASGPNVSVDPDTGVARPVNPRTLSFRLEGNLVKRTGADQGPIVLTHDLGTDPARKKGAAKAKKKH